MGNQLPDAHPDKALSLSNVAAAYYQLGEVTLAMQH